MRIVILLAMLLLATPAAAQITPLFEADLTAGDFPDYNFDLTRDDGETCFINSAAAGVGPTGQDAARVTFVNNTCPQQFTAGWDMFSMTGTTAGNSRFVRYIQRINSPWTPGFGTTAKYQIIGSESSRVIIQMNTTGAGVDGLRIYIAKNIDAFPGEATDSVNLTVGAWQWLQFEMRCNTSAASDDGYLKMWVDTATYASPSQSQTGVNIDCADWTSGGWPGFWNEAMQGTPTMSIDLVALIHDDAFDSAWTSGGGGGQPGPSGTGNKGRLRMRVKEVASAAVVPALWLAPLGFVAAYVRASRGTRGGRS